MIGAGIFVPKNRHNRYLDTGWLPNLEFANIDNGGNIDWVSGGHYSYLSYLTSEPDYTKYLHLKRFDGLPEFFPDDNFAIKGIAIKMFYYCTLQIPPVSGVIQKELYIYDGNTAGISKWDENNEVFVTSENTLLMIGSDSDKFGTDLQPVSLRDTNFGIVLSVKKKGFDIPIDQNEMSISNVFLKIYYEDLNS